MRLDKIGVVMLAAVGDAVHALPVLNAIRRHHPSSEVTWILQPGLAPFVEGHPAVDRVIPFHRREGWRGFLDVRRRLAHERFDTVLVLQPYFKAGLVASFAPADVRLGFDRRRARDLSWIFTNAKLPPHPVQHMQDQYLEFLDALAVPRGPLEWDLGPWPAERAWQREFTARFDRPIASIVVGTSKAAKDWMPERWAALVDVLYADYGLQPVLVGGRSERELAAERVIMERARHAPVSALGSGLRPLVSIIDASALVVSPDTGPLHISVALGRPVVSLMGYTNPKRTGPYRRFHDLLIDAYGEPGEDYPISMENRPGRMERISVADVVERVEVWRQVYASTA
ncbi:MAG TPA: glycosyltransferase family 9 protein [Gemmatimonadaceae bacterium]|nr:glycosyltransferase family 9 protein [Gemmatimonadaceae bacterium]